MTLELAIQIGNLVLVLVGVAGLVVAIRTYKRQTNAQIFLEYTGRYEKIMESFPANSLQSRLMLEGNPPNESQELSLAVLKYLNLCSEEYYLYRKGYLAKDVWTIWESELVRTLRSPLVLREWKRLEHEFESYPEFKGFVESTQSSIARRRIA